VLNRDLPEPADPAAVVHPASTESRG
jgi:hypothetical protein